MRSLDCTHIERSTQKDTDGSKASHFFLSFSCARYLLLVITFAQSDAVEIPALEEPGLDGTALSKGTESRQQCHRNVADLINMSGNCCLTSPAEARAKAQMYTVDIKYHK